MLKKIFQRDINIEKFSFLLSQEWRSSETAKFSCMKTSKERLKN